MKKLARTFKKSPLAIVALVALVGAFFLGTGMAFGTASLAIQPETAETVAGVRGHIRFSGGADGLGTRFVTAGEYCGDREHCRSEAIVVDAWTDTQSVWRTAMCSYRYKVSVTDDRGVYRERADLSSRWFEPSYKGQSQVDYYLADDFARNPLYLYGPIQGGIKVELEANVTDTWLKRFGSAFPALKKCNTYSLAADGAELVRGDGNVKLKAGQSDLFEEGQTVKFSVSTGAGHWRATVFGGDGAPVCGAKDVGGFQNALSFLLRFYDPGQSDQMTQAENSATKDIPVNLAPQFQPAKDAASSLTGASGCKASVTWKGAKNGELTFLIPAGSFRSDGQNKWTIRLENTLTTYAQDAFFVIDKKAKAPEPPKVAETVNTEADGKKLITYRMTSRQNGATGAPIVKFVLDVWYGQENQLPPSMTSPNWVLNGYEIPATLLSPGVYAGEHTVRVEPRADLQYRMYAVDAQGRTSGTQLNEEDRTILEKEGNITDPNGGSRGETDLDGKGEVPAGPAPTEPAKANAVLLAIVGILGGLVAWTYVPGKPPVKVAAIALLSLALAYYGGLFG